MSATTMGKFYRVAAWSFLLTLAIVAAMAASMALTGGRERPENLPDAVRIILGMLGAFSAFAICVLWIGMIWNCLAFSGLPLLSRVGWLVLLFVTNMLGALIYYFVVYQRQGEPALEMSA